MADSLDKRPQTTIRLRVDYELLAWLDQYAQQERQTRSALVRGLIVELMKREAGHAEPTRT